MIFSLYATLTISETVPIQGHVSTMLLLEGLIGVILSFFFFIIMAWGIRDAYITSEKKRMKQKVLKDGAYFKNVYEESFEYIVISIIIQNKIKSFINMNTRHINPCVHVQQRYLDKLY